MIHQRTSHCQDKLRQPSVWAIVTRSFSHITFPRGVNCIQICGTNLDTGCLRRPESVQLFQRSFRIPGSYRLRCCPREHSGWNALPLDQREPHHLVRVCSLAYGPGLDQRGCPPQASPPRPVAAEGVRATTIELTAQPMVVVVFCAAANATRGKTSDGYSPSR